MNYVIEQINDGVAKIRYEDDSWAQILLHEKMTEDEVDMLAEQFAPKRGKAPEFLFEGQVREAKKPIKIKDAGKKNNQEELPEIPEWLKNRIDAYGNVRTQLEFIVEHGLEAWVNHVQEIKEQFPKN